MLEGMLLSCGLARQILAIGYWIFVFQFLVPLEITRASSSCEYFRYSCKHSYCLRNEKGCNILEKGVQKPDKQLIVDLHNEIRDKVATGLETAKSLPQASDMMEMEWENELADTAQGHASQCKFEHDCSECRKLSHFNVGQNIYQRSLYLKVSAYPDPNWRDVIRAWYRELEYFDPNTVESFQPELQEGTVHHFVQMIWAKTWKIGCGYAMYRDDDNYYHQFYVCDYGPEGSVDEEPIYTPGEPCANCPINSCCGSSCPDKTTSYNSLCRITSGQYPVYPMEQDTLFVCYINDSSTCPRMSPSGLKKWQIPFTYSDPYAAIVLSPGEWSALNFTVKFAAEDPSCLHVSYRMGQDMPCPVKEDGKGKAKLHIFLFEEAFGFDVTISDDTMDFEDVYVPLPYDSEFKFSVSFGVDESAKSARYFEISKIYVLSGDCPY